MLAVVVRAHDPSGARFQFNAAALSTPAQPYEDLRCAGATRARVNVRAYSHQSTSARFIGAVYAGSVNRELIPVRIRTGVAGGRIGSASNQAIVTNPARIESVGAIYRPLRSLFHLALCICQDAREHVVEKFRSFSCVAHEKHSSEGLTHEGGNIIRQRGYPAQAFGQQNYV